MHQHLSVHFNVLKCISYRETNIFRGSQLCKRGGSNFELGIFEKAQQMGDVLLQKFLYFDSDCLCLDSTSSSFPLLQKLEMADRKQHIVKRTEMQDKARSHPVQPSPKQK